jgi:hypothetical protein
MAHGHRRRGRVVVRGSARAGSACVHASAQTRSNGVPCACRAAEMCHVRDPRTAVRTPRHRFRERVCITGQTPPTFQASSLLIEGHRWPATSTQIRKSHTHTLALQFPQRGALPLEHLPSLLGLRQGKKEKILLLQPPSARRRHVSAR